MRRSFPLAILLLTIALGACGTRGPLTMPPPRIKPPATAPAPVTPAEPAEPIAVDLNTPEDPAR